MNDNDLPPLIETPPGRYRHYKGGEYEVLGTVRHSETLEPMRFDGQSPPPGVPPKGSGVSSSRLRLAAAEPQRAVIGEFNGERITGLTWPASQQHVTVLELTY